MPAKTKKMDESTFAQIVKEFNAFGELIRARQDEKQAVIDEFNSESKRFYFGRISEKTLASSAAKTNKELRRLDEQIRATIEKAGDLAAQARKFASAQSPKSFKATLSGVVSSGSKRPARKRKSVRRKPAKRKTSTIKKRKKATKKSRTIKSRKKKK